MLNTIKGDLMKTVAIETGAGTDRNLFGSNVTFYERDDALLQIIRAYNEASEVAAKSARTAVQVGDADLFRRAQWDEAVVRALEYVLHLFSGDDDGEKFSGMPSYCLPDRPNFGNWA